MLNNFNKTSIVKFFFPDFFNSELFVNNCRIEVFNSGHVGLFKFLSFKLLCDSIMIINIIL